MRSIRSSRRRCGGSSSSTPITSRTRRPRPSASPARRAPIPSPASPPGIACLWGPAHGGANEAALNMLREIGRPERIPEYIARAKDKDDPFRLMGFGHRVYKNFDPRAKVMQATARGGAEGARHLRSGARHRPGARADRAQGRLFHREEALPERRFLFGRDPQRDRLPDRDVHRPVRARPHRRLGRAVERDDLRSRAEDRPPAPALYAARRSATTCRSAQR